MKKILLILLFIAVSIISFTVGKFLSINNKDGEVFRVHFPVEKQKPYEVYTINNLTDADISPGEIDITEVIEEEGKFTSYLFKFSFAPNPEKKGIKSTTGQINVPSTTDSRGLVLMLRGYVDQELYKTGDGTRNAAKFFANNGFVTIAPDFLGYGNSDEEAGNIFESRFQTYTTTLSLLKTLEVVKNNSDMNKLIKSPNNLITNSLINYSTVSLWGHSNGGQIALTVLEITGNEYPTTLWAPVSKPFPYSILYYTDESEDRGKLIRRELAKFEDVYDTDKYSLTGYLDEINAPLQIHQGTNDDSVPKDWSDNLVDRLKIKEVNYIIHRGADHNMRPVWDDVVKLDLDFFNEYTQPNP